MISNKLTINDSLLLKIKNTKPIEVIAKKAKKQKSKKIYQTERKYNLLDKDSQLLFTKGISSVDGSQCAKLQTTIIALEGLLSNVNFLEEELIKFLTPSSKIVEISCIYDILQYTPWVELTKLQKAEKEKNKSTRGRKPKIVVKKPRKSKGTFGGFNSQITFSVLIRSEKLYKIKVFRNGAIHIPGLNNPNLLHEVIESISYIIDEINIGFEKMKLFKANKDMDLKNDTLKGALDTSETMVDTLKEKTTNNTLNNTLIKEQKIQLNELFCTMINTKTRYMMAKDELLNLAVMKSLLVDNQSTYFKDISISYIKYTRDDTNLSIKICAPVLGNANKEIRVQIFMSGKINILGALEYDTIIKIYDILIKFMEHSDNRSKIMVIDKK